MKPVWQIAFGLLIRYLFITFINVLILIPLAKALMYMGAGV